MDVADSLYFYYMFRLVIIHYQVGVRDTYMPRPDIIFSFMCSAHLPDDDQ
jgi:hypothetical protein